MKLKPKEQERLPIAHEADLRRGALIARLRCQIPRNTMGARFDIEFFDQLERCKDDDARRLLVGAKRVSEA